MIFFCQQGYPTHVPQLFALGSKLAPEPESQPDGISIPNNQDLTGYELRKPRSQFDMIVLSQ